MQTEINLNYYLEKYRSNLVAQIDRAKVNQDTVDTLAIVAVNERFFYDVITQEICSQFKTGQYTDIWLDRKLKIRVRLFIEWYLFNHWDLPESSTIEEVKECFNDFIDRQTFLALILEIFDYYHDAYPENSYFLN